MAKRFNLDGQEIKALTICLIGGAGFIGSNLCEKLMKETSHKAIVFDVRNNKIKHLLHESCSWLDRIQFHNARIYESSIKESDLIIDLGLIERRSYFETLPEIIKCSAAYKKRLIYFSSSEVYGKTIGSFLPKNDPRRQDPNFYVLKEDSSPCILGPIKDNIWSRASSKQFTERIIYDLYTQNHLEFTIVRPFSLVGPGMDFVPGLNGISRVIACFFLNLINQEPLPVVDGGKTMRSFCHINDAIEAVLLMISKWEVGNPNNEVTIKRLAEMMIEVFSNITGVESTTVNVSAEKFDGLGGYEDCDKRIPSMEIIKAQLDWTPRTPLKEALEAAMKYYFKEL